MRARRPSPWSLGLLLAILTGCTEPEPPSPAPSAAGPFPWFRDESAERGVAFTYRSGHRDRHLMPEIIGGGAALFDMDGDADLDLYLVQGGRLGGDLEESDPAAPGNLLFRNDGSGGFHDVTPGSGAGDRRYGMGVACGDYDNDGDVDLYVTNCGPNVLLRNDGRGKFEDVSRLAGVALESWSTSAAFLDHDRDGDLDLFVCSYLKWSPDLELECFNTMGGADYCSPRNYLAPAQDVLYRNDGAGRFTNATRELGLAAGSGTGLGVVCADFTGDGWIDIFVANDGMRDQLWVNLNGRGFVDRGVELGCAFDKDGRAAAGMGVVTADVDDDGDFDLLVCNLRNESDSLFLNQGGSFFAYRSAAAGLAAVSRRFTRFGMGWYDFDHDGRLDLYQANGRVMRQRTIHGNDPYAEPNLLMRGTVDGTFRRVEPPGGEATQSPGASRAAAFGDIDGDGAIDVVVVNRDGPVQVLRNCVRERGNWISFRIVDEHGRDAHGAEVRISLGALPGRPDGRTRLGVVGPASSYLASNGPEVHFGLGTAAEVLEVDVTWPDRTVQRYGARPANRRHTLTRTQ